MRPLPDELEAMLGRIALALQQEAERFSALGGAPKIDAAALQIKCVIDPVNQRPAYEGLWRDLRNARCGMLSINSDHSFYAEYDMFCLHPRDSRWFVEMVTAWGNADSFKCEATLIPSV